MSGWVLLNSVTIWFSRVRVSPDHIVCQVTFTTPDADPVLLPVEVDDADEAAGPPQAARVSTALVASSAAGAVQLLARRLPGMLSVTSRSVSWCSAVRISCSSVALSAAAHSSVWTCVSAHIHGRIVTAHNLIVKGAAV